MTFERAFSETIRREGGYVLHTVAGDRGGMTYAGIARKMNPRWPGWAMIDAGQPVPTELVRQFYREGYWTPLCGDVLREDIAHSLFDFAVNTSAPGRPKIAVKLAQLVAGVEPDGSMGPKSIVALNAIPRETFASAYFVAKMKRYAEIVNRDRTQAKFLLGWLNRSLGALE